MEDLPQPKGDVQKRDLHVREPVPDRGPACQGWGCVLSILGSAGIVFAFVWFLGATMSHGPGDETSGAVLLGAVAVACLLSGVFLFFYGAVQVPARRWGWRPGRGPSATRPPEPRYRRGR